MSEIMQLTELPESIEINESEIISTTAVVDTKLPKTFVVAGVGYTADFSTVTRCLRKELKRNIFANQTFSADGKTDMSGSFLVDNLEMMDQVNEILAKTIFGIPKNLDINALPCSEIDPVIDYVEGLDLLGLAAAAAKAKA